MSSVLGLVIFALVSLFFIGLVIYFVLKRNPPILKLVWQNERYEVYELLQDASIPMMYEVLALDFDKLLVAGSDQEDFYQKHKDKLSKNCGNFFLSKRYSLNRATPDNLFVTIISLAAIGGCFVTTRSYLESGFWGAGLRLIIPRQKS